MEILTKESLDAAIKKCQDDDGYRVLIVTEYAEDHTDILRNLSLNYDVLISHNRPNSYSYAQFSNGSIIEMISTSNNIRGRKAYLVLCVEKIFYDTDMRCIYSTVEVRRPSYNI